VDQKCWPFESELESADWCRKESEGGPGLTGYGTLLLNSRAVTSELWSCDEGNAANSPSGTDGRKRLATFPTLAMTGSPVVGRCPFPILMPSSGRPDGAWLDLTDAMQSREYAQIIIVKARELIDYQRLWPELSFFVLPDSANCLGIGAARFWALELARRICHTDSRFAFIMDDNVRVWKCLRVGTPDSYFDNSPYPREELADGSDGSKRDIPLIGVLNVLEQMDHDERAKFGMFGFWRLGRTPNICKPFARRHVYKAILYNLDVIREVNFRPKVKIWEDLEFNLRVSGKTRVDGGVSRKMDPWNEEGVLKQGGVWLSRQREVTCSNGNSRRLLGSYDDEGAAIICKFYRFAYVQYMSKKGGCASLKPPCDDGDDGEDDEDSDDDVDDVADVEMEDDLSVITAKVAVLRGELNQLHGEQAKLEDEKKRLEYEIDAKSYDLLDDLFSLESQLEALMKRVRSAEQSLAEALQLKEQREEEARVERERNEAAARRAKEEAKLATARAEQETELNALEAQFKAIFQSYMSCPRDTRDEKKISLMTLKDEIKGLEQQLGIR